MKPFPREGRPSRNWSGDVLGRFDVEEHLAKRLQAMVAEVEHMDHNTVLNVPLDDLVVEMSARYQVVPPTLRWEEAEERAEETSIEIQADPRMVSLPHGRKVISVPATWVEVGVPVSGDTELLGAYGRSRPSRQWGEFSFVDGWLLFSGRWQSPSPEDLRDWLGRERSDLDRLLTPVASHAHAWNAKLVERIRGSLESRRKRVLQNRGIEGSLGLKVVKRSDAPKPVPARRRRPESVSGQTRHASAAFEPEPELGEDVYHDIVQIIRGFARSLERSPRVAQKYDEEELRDQIVMHLNGHYEGLAGGEMFNGAGKTDILVRVDGRNVFIAECKFWKGKKSLKSAISQLFGYLVWRDTKSAIILLIRNKQATAAIETAKEVIEQHASFKRKKPNLPTGSPESDVVYVLRHPDDDDREIRLALIPVVIRAEGD